jgi:hypothetical protein
MSLVSRSVQPKSLFDPRMYGNCLAWFDAADASTFVLSGSNVTQWNDKSSNARNATSDPNPPQRVTNGVSFNGSSQGLLVSGLSPVLTGTSALTGGETICVVGTFTGTASRSYCILGPDRYSGGTGAGTRSFEVLRTTSNVVNWKRYGSGAEGAYTGPIASNVPFLVTGRNTGSTGSTRLNGTDSATTATTSYAYTFATASYIGCRAGGDLFYQGTLNEILVFNWITLPYLQAVEGYLAAKWKLSTNLPVAHPYRTTVPFLGQFNPRTSLPNCYFWWDGADESSFVLSGSAVSVWSNKAATGGRLVAGAVAPTRVSTGVEFNGTSQYLALGAGSIGATGLSLTMYFYVVTFSGSANRFYAIQGGDSNVSVNAFGINRTSTTSNAVSWFQGTAITGQASNAGALSNTRILIKTLVFSNTTTGVTSTGVVLNGSGPVATSSSGLSSSSATVWFGAHSTNNVGGVGYYFSGILHEMIAFSNSVNSFVDGNNVVYLQTQIEGYLAQKWNLASSTPANHALSRITPYPGRLAIA